MPALQRKEQSYEAVIGYQCVVSLFVWMLADGAMELSIAIAGLLGGAYGIRIAGYLKQARAKSKAIKEIVAGNELFKQLWPEQADRLKESQRKQSPVTRQIVTRLKAG